MENFIPINLQLHPNTYNYMQNILIKSVCIDFFFLYVNSLIGAICSSTMATSNSIGIGTGGGGL
jgi:hypothetical protein